MRTLPSCKQWLEEVSQRGATVTPGHWYSPPLSSIEMASLEAETDTGTVLNQTRQWDGNDIFSCSEHRGQIVLVFDILYLDFVPCYTSFNIWSDRARGLCTAWLGFIKYFLTFQPQLNRYTIFIFRIFKVIICQGRWKTKGFIFISFLSVHLPSLHEWRAIFCLTFSRSDRIGNGKSLWKAELVQDNASVSAVVHHTRSLNITHDLFHWLVLPVTKCNWNIMCQKGYYTEHYAELSVVLTCPFCAHARDNSMHIISFSAYAISKAYRMNALFVVFDILHCLWYFSL